MTEQELREVIERAVGDVDLQEDEIPAIDLYLDQILSLMAEKNRTATAQYQDRHLTKTMVNNYSKDGLISPIAGKKYTRAQVAEMLLIYGMKNSLSIDEIKRVLVGVREECDFSGEDMVDMYHTYLTLKEKNRERVGMVVDQLLLEDQLLIDEDYDFFAALLDILSMSAYLKAVGREMLMTRYADPDLVQSEKANAQKRERKEEKVAAKRERKKEKVAVKRERKQSKVAAKQQKKEQQNPTPQEESYE